MRAPVFCHFCQTPLGECLVSGKFLIKHNAVLICEPCVFRCVEIIAEAKQDARDHAALEHRAQP
jgi:hypothetical protein